jgi:hypothetical protein
MIPIQRACGYSCGMAASDSNAILPVRIGTAIAIIATVILGFIGPILPSDVTQALSQGSPGSPGSPSIDVWWFGVGLVASISGILGLVFLHRRASRLGLRG